SFTLRVEPESGACNEPWGGAGARPPALFDDRRRAAAYAGCFILGNAPARIISASNGGSARLASRSKVATRKRDGRLRSRRGAAPSASDRLAGKRLPSLGSRGVHAAG